MVLELRSCTVDLERRVVHRGGARDTLSEYEHGVLAYLSEHAGESVSRAALLSAVWGWQASQNTRTVDNTVMRLRAKIEDDPSSPDHILTVRGVGYRFEKPPERAPTSPGLIGREAALAALLERLQTGGLLVLVGPGGVGKTTLARAALARRSGVFCDVSAAVARDDVAEVVAAALTVSGSDLPAAVGAALRQSAPRLLVLDNVEQVADSVAPMFQRWAEQLPPDAAILLTSRRRLRTPAAQAIPLTPLAIDDGVALLRLRSEAPASGPPTDAERALVAAVDALPLAIELVAGWSDVAPPEALLADIRGELAALTSRDVRAPHHQSVAALMARSWRLLSPDEARAMRQLSAFVGGFSLPDAAHVVEAPAARLLGRLLDRSLLRRERSPSGEVRFSMLALIHADASERLAADPEEQGATHRRHAALFAERCQTLRQLRAADLGRFHRAAAAERGNYLAIYQRFQNKDAELAGWAALLLALLSTHTGDRDAILTRAPALLPRLPAGSLRMRLQECEIARLLELSRFEECEAKLAAILPAAWEEGPESGVHSECRLAHLRISRGDAAGAIALLSGTLERASAAGPVSGYLQGRVHGTIGNACFSLGSIDQAEPHLQQAIALFLAEGHRDNAEWFEQRLSIIWWMRGRPEAEDLTRRLLSRARETGFIAHIIERSLDLGCMLLEQGALDEASALFEEAVAAAVQHAIYLPALHLWWGDLALARGERTIARSRWLESLRLNQSSGPPRTATIARARVSLLDGDRAAFESLLSASDPLTAQELLALRAGYTTHQENGFARLSARTGYLLRRRARDAVPQ